MALRGRILANGNHEFSIKNWEAYFAPIEAGIELIARDRGLQLVRYDHDSPSWRLKFIHPSGGVGIVAVDALTDRELALRAFVFQDDFAAGRRTTRCFCDRSVERSGSVLPAALNELIDLVLAGRFDGETIVSDGHRAIWSSFCAEEFERAATLGLQVAR